MQHKLYPQCIDPNLLNVNEHIPAAHLASDCFAPFDDVEIATGQAGFDDDDGDVHPNMSTWINPHCSHAFVQGADDVWADFEDKYVDLSILSSLTRQTFANASMQLNPSSQCTREAKGQLEV